jgi:hypothetical protein
MMRGEQSSRAAINTAGREMPRKASISSQGRSRGDSGASDASASYSGPALSYPVTFLVTPVEAHKLQVALSKLGLASTPQKEITITNPPTPLPSYPNTPVSGLGPKGSFFQPFSTISESSAATQQDIKPRLRIALQNAFHDDVLPKSSRSALRAFLAGWMVNYTLKAIAPALMKRNT